MTLKKCALRIPNLSPLRKKQREEVEMTKDSQGLNLMKVYNSNLQA